MFLTLRPSILTRHSLCCRRSGTLSERHCKARPEASQQKYTLIFGLQCDIQHTMALREQFLKDYDNVVEPLFKSREPGLQSITERLKDILSYNTAGGKMNRGCAVVHTANLLGGQHLTFQATVLGWCVEILQAFLLVADDIMDKSELRRGQPCWYKQPSVGLMAINDAFLLESSVFELLKSHLGKEPYYVKAMELILSVIRTTEFGQALDLEAEVLPLEQYTMERYDSIVLHKTAHYSFYLPVALAMHACGRDSEIELHSAKEILLRIGHYFQVQDDYLDCYGDPEIIGKVGTDIQEKKCSWLFLTALNLVSDEEKNVLFSNYGKNEEECVYAVKSIYKKLDIRQKYLDYSAATYANICDDIENEKSGLPSEIFQDFLDAIHKRSK